jgi:hypothetical protein
MQGFGMLKYAQIATSFLFTRGFERRRLLLLIFYGIETKKNLILQCKFENQIF